MPNEKLRKVAEIELAGVRYDVAKNGHYRLVHEVSRDDYGNPVYRALVGGSFSDVGKMWKFTEALIDCLGEALEKLKAFEDARKRNMGAEP